MANEWIFTSCGNSGRYGVSQAQIDSSYIGTNLTGKVTSQSGIQIWTPPYNGLYTIEVWGARSGTQPEYGAGGYGLGRKLKGNFILKNSKSLKILIGQVGGDGGSDYSAGGGGGTFVAIIDNTPLCIGGGGGGVTSDSAGSNGQTTTTTPANPNVGQGYTNSPSGGGGGGFYSDGSASFTDGGGKAFINGGYGGVNGASCGYGGFGGGGGSVDEVGCGGGGYTGGRPTDSPPSEGGGSFIATDSQNAVWDLGLNSDNGRVIITLLKVFEYNLIRSEGNIYTFKDSEWINLNISSPTQSDFENQSISSLSEVFSPITKAFMPMDFDKNLEDGFLWRKKIVQSKYNGIKVLNCGEVVVADFGTYKAWSDGTFATHAGEYLNPTKSNYKYIGAIGSGVYRIQPSEIVSPIDVYCDMNTSNDEGGWMLILNTGVKATLTTMTTSFGTSPILTTQTTMSKLSDANINLLRGSILDKSIIRLDRPNNPALKSYPIYFRQGNPFTSYAGLEGAQDGAKTIYYYYTTYNDSKNGTNRYGANSTNYGSALSTWGGTFPATMPSAYYIIMDYRAEGLISNDTYAYEGSRSERCALLWVKRI